MATLLTCGLANTFLAKPMLAFWQAGVLSHQLRFTTGDWTPPAISVKLKQVDKNYLIDELVGSDCQLEGELELDEVGFKCRLDLKNEANLPRWLSFKYHVSISGGLLLLQPSFVVEVQTPSSIKTVFIDSVSSTDSDNDWRYGWLSLDELSKLTDGQGKTTLVFRTLPTQVDSFSQSQVRLKKLTTLRLTAKRSNQLKLVADEPVTWVLDYQVGNEVRQLQKSGQEVEVDLSELDVHALPNSWQIRAVDQAGNESQVLRPQFYIIDDDQDRVTVANLEHHQEVDGRLSLRLDVVDAWLDQVAGFRLRQKGANSWQEVNLVKVMPFVKPTFLTSLKGERVVLTTSRSPDSADFCLDALTLLGEPQELVCTY